MNLDNYLYILNIKVWSDLMETTTNYGNIETVVKDLFLQKEHKYNNFFLYWRKHIWSKQKKQFNLGDIVVENSHLPDELLVKIVTENINKLNDELHTIGRLSDKETIIFFIVKHII